MSQKDYKLEIIGNLIGNSFHARALAKKLKTNPMMVSRKINELCDFNVFDYKEEGKNKIYFIKDTAEAKAYIYMAENYKLIKVLEKLDFKLARQSGSHKIYKNSEGIRVTVPFHSGKILHPKLLKSILRDIELSVDEFKKFL